MTLTIISLILAFLWLGYETDWLRVRLLAGLGIEPGTCSEWKLLNSKVTKDMKRDLIKNWQLNKIGNALFSGNHLQPLCGWGFAYQYRNFTPEYKVELITEHSKITMRTKSIPVLRDAFRVYRNPYLKVKLT